MDPRQDAAWWHIAVLALFAFIFSFSIPAIAEDPQRMVEQAVRTELAAANSDNSKWLCYETDRKLGRTVKQWVAETTRGTLVRVLEENGRTLNQQEQRRRMESYMRDTGAQEKRRKEAGNDDRESAKMLNLLPHAFLWTQTASQGDNSTLHFKPNPRFRASDYESRVFAVMEGDMVVDKAGHRIVSIKGRMMRGVKFFGGMLGGLDPGGTFDVERRMTGHGEWQITETHVHIHGRALLFKSISEQEDDEKTKFRELPQNISFQDAENILMKAP